MEKLENLKQLFLDYKYWFIVGGIIASLLLGTGIYFIYQSFNESTEEVLLEKVNIDKNANLTEEDQEKEELCQIMVDIKGEIQNPGLYQMECDSRVQDVIDLAGDITWKADTSVLNLSKKVIDEMVIIVYSKEQVANFAVTKQEETQKQESCQTQAEVKNDACITTENMLDTTTKENDVIGDTPVNSLISLNSASKEELMTLPGIGESKADSIILYREEQGGFQSIEDIKNVKGIGDSIFEKIKDSITV